MNRRICKVVGYLLALVSILLMLPACGITRPSGTKLPTTKPTQETEKNTEATVDTVTPDVQQTVIGLVEALFTLPEDITSAAETSDTAQMLCLMNAQTNCTIGTITADTVELSITVPDMKTIFSEQLDENTVITDPAAESKRLMEAILSRIQSTDCPTVTNTVTAAIVHGENGMQIVMSEELADAMYGNMLTLFRSLNEQTEG